MSGFAHQERKLNTRIPVQLLNFRAVMFCLLDLIIRLYSRAGKMQQILCSDGLCPSEKGTAPRDFPRWSRKRWFSSFKPYIVNPLLTKHEVKMAGWIQLASFSFLFFFFFLFVFRLDFTNSQRKKMLFQCSNIITPCLTLTNSNTNSVYSIHECNQVRRV